MSARDMEGRTLDRLKWVTTQLPYAPARVWQVTVVLIRYADSRGRAFPSIRTLQRATDLDHGEVVEALDEAVALKVIRHDGTSEYGTDAWVIIEGQELPDPLPLFTKGVVDRVRGMGLTDRQLIVLEAMVDIGYRYADSSIHFTIGQLRRRLRGRYEPKQLRDTLHSLRTAGYLSLMERGYGDARPRVYQLHFPTEGRLSSQDDNVEGRLSNQDDNVEGRLSSQDDNVEGRLSSQDDNVEGRLSSQDDNVPTPPIKELIHLKESIIKSSSSGSPSKFDDDDDGQRQFIQACAEAFRQSIPGAPGTWRRSYRDSAIEIVQPYVAHFGRHPARGDVVELLNRCAAYGAGSWAYVARALSGWVEEQVDAAPPTVRDDSATQQAMFSAMPVDGRVNTLWQEVLEEHVRPSVTKPTYDSWLKETAGVSWVDGVFTVQAPNVFVAGMIEERLYRILSRALQRMLDCPVDVRIVSKPTS